jgi:uncharacterized membrane protein
MEEAFKEIGGYIALTVEVVATLLIACGAIEALLGILRLGFAAQATPGGRKRIWVRFGVWLLLGLEFELAADIIRSAISPTWQEIGQLAAIAVIRTFLNFFLEQDLEKYSEPERPAESVAAEARP